MESLKESLFETIAEFNEQNESVIDWTVVWEDEDRFEIIIDACDILIDSIALIADIDDMKRIHLAGKLSVVRAQLTLNYGNEQLMGTFLNYANKFEQLLHEVINCSSWLSKAEQHFDEYAEFVDADQSEEDLTQKQREYFRPVIMAFALMSAITIDNEESPFNQECEDDECNEEEE